MTAHQVYALRDLGEIFDGPHATPERRTEGPYFLNISSLENGHLNLGASDRVSDEDFKRWTRRVTPRADDLLFSYETRLGDAALMPADIQACLGRRMALIRPDTSIIEPRFLLYLYLSREFQLLIERNTIHGATVNRIGLSTMGGWEVVIPPLPKQRAIAEVLGALDDKIASNRACINSLSNLAREMYAGAIQRSWSQHGLGTITTMLTRGITPLYSEDQRSVLVLSQKCVRSQRVDLGPARRTDPSRTRASKSLQINDVLVNSTGQGTLGRIARWTQEVEATPDSHITIVRFDPSLVDTTCAGYGLLCEQSLIEAMGEGSTGQTELSRRELAKVMIDVPHPDLQPSLGVTLRCFDQSELALSAENRCLAKTRDALLPELMSGRLRVRDAEKTVGRVL